METVVNHVSGLDSSLARALCWGAAWDMVRDAELPARDYVALICNGLPAEHDISLVTASLAQAQGALTYYADPTWAPVGWALLAATAISGGAAAGPLAAPAAAQPVITGGLVNITITNVLNNNTVTVNVPVNVAANVCAQVLASNPVLTCTAST